MTVLTIIGAGSTVFAAELMTDFLTAPGLDAGEFRLRAHAFTFSSIMPRISCTVFSGF